MDNFFSSIQSSKTTKKHEKKLKLARAELLYTLSYEIPCACALIT